jgi:hypothetical protein
MVKHFVLKDALNADVHDLARAVQVYGVEAVPSFEEHLGVNMLTVRGSAEALMKIQEFLDSVDIARKELVVCGYLIAASNEESVGRDVPSELQPLVEELREKYYYRSFRLLDVLNLRTMELHVPPAVVDGPFHRFSVSELRVYEQGASTLVSFRTNMGQRSDVIHDNGVIAGEPPSINAHIEVREGEKTVIGRAKLNHIETVFFAVEAFVLSP